MPGLVILVRQVVNEDAEEMNGNLLEGGLTSCSLLKSSYYLLHRINPCRMRSLLSLVD